MAIVTKGKRMADNKPSVFYSASDKTIKGEVPAGLNLLDVLTDSIDARPMSSDREVPARKTQGGGRIQSLDGLRALSIGLVLIAHTCGTQGVRWIPPAYSPTRYFGLGEMGVRVFFVISGFLITSLLLGEVRKTGTVSLLRFYYRRTLRIFPPFYVLLICVLLLEWAGLLQLWPRDALHAATYTMNYHEHRAWFLGHTWSLSVEEQFYLLWPAIMLLAGRKRALWIAAAFVLLAPLIRIASLKLLPVSQAGIGETFPTTADSIALGCLLAGTRDRLMQRAWYRALMSSPWMAAAPLLLFAANGILNRWTSLGFLVGYSVQNLIIALCIDWAVRNPVSRVGRLLNSAPLVTIGTWSYSLYLWQQLFLNRRSDAWISSFPINLVLAFLFAAVSFYVIERPALRFRERFEVKLFGRTRRSSGETVVPVERRAGENASRAAGP